MSSKEVDYLQIANAFLRAVCDIPQSWLAATPRQRMWWLVRRMSGLIFSLPLVLVLAVVLGLIKSLAILGGYLQLWCALIIGPEPEPLDYQI